VIAYDPYVAEERFKGLSIRRCEHLDELLEASDLITLHIAKTDLTTNMIDTPQLAKMKKGVRIINMARAELVCDDGMLAALKSGQVAWYVTDFPNGATAGAPGVIPIPHLGASTPESEDNCVAMASDEIIEYLESGNIVNSVNLPPAVLPRSGSPRLCVIYKREADIAEKLIGAVSGLGGSIGDKVSASDPKFSQAYFLAQLDSLPEGLEDAVKKIDGVTRVRVIGS